MINHRLLKRIQELRVVYESEVRKTTEEYEGELNRISQVLRKAQQADYSLEDKNRYLSGKKMLEELCGNLEEIQKNLRGLPCLVSRELHTLKPRKFPRGAVEHQFDSVMEECCKAVIGMGQSTSVDGDVPYLKALCQGMIDVRYIVANADRLLAESGILAMRKREAVTPLEQALEETKVLYDEAKKCENLACFQQICQMRIELQELKRKSETIRLFHDPAAGEHDGRVLIGFISNSIEAKDADFIRNVLEMDPALLRETPYYFAPKSGAGSIIVKMHNRSLREEECSIAKNIFYSMVSSFSAKRLCFSAIECGTFEPWFAKLAHKIKQIGKEYLVAYQENGVSMDGMAESSDDVQKLLDCLHLKQRERTIKEYELSRLYGAAVSGADPIIPLFIHGYPAGFERYRRGAGDHPLIHLQKKSRSVGIFPIVFLDVDSPDFDETYAPYPDESSAVVIDYTDPEHVRIDGVDGNLNILTPDFDENHFWKGLKNYYQDRHADEEASKAIHLETILPTAMFDQDSRRERFSEVLTLPVGKAAGTPFMLELSAQNAPHAAIIGTTGSGKSALINTLILSATNLYSPDELEIHMIGMDKGDFKVFAECGLPHLKTLVAGSNVYTAAEALATLDDTRRNRQDNILGSKGSIYVYNNSVPKKDRLPRMLIVVDEFQQLLDKSDAMDHITNMAKLGRSCGMSLVLCSQSFPVGMGRDFGLYTHRFEFKSGENQGQLISGVERRGSELEALPGLCFYAKGQEQAVLMRGAFCGEDQELRGHIHDVVNKYKNVGDYRMELNIDDKPLFIDRPEDDVPFARNARVDYLEEGRIHVRLGRTYLGKKNIEYVFDEVNYALFLCGSYLETKKIEAAIIKDMLWLSNEIEGATIFYLDYQKNQHKLRKRRRLWSQKLEKWLLTGKFRFAEGRDLKETLEDITYLIDDRENDAEEDIYPVLVIINKIETMFSERDGADTLCELMERGKYCGVYFLLQAEEPVRNRLIGSITDAIILPDRQVEGEVYSSASVIEHLSTTQMGSGREGERFIRILEASPLNPHIHLLCSKNNMTQFIPYEYTAGFYGEKIELFEI